MADNSRTLSSAEAGARQAPQGRRAWWQVWRPRVAWALRGLFGAAAAALVVWLFLIYRAPGGPQYPGREKVIFWHMWSGPHAKMVQRIVDRFNTSQSTYEVVPLSVFGGTVKTLISAAGGSPPDCLAQWDSVIPAWVERNALTPLESEEIMGAERWAKLRDKLYPAVRDIGTYKVNGVEHFYGLSIGMNVFAMYYRPSYFAEAGLDPEKFPKTIAELDSIVPKLWKYDAKGRISRIGFMPSRLQDWSAVFGGTLYDEQSHRLTLTNPFTLNALQWLTAYAERYKFEKVAQFTSGLPNERSADWPFISGAYAITIDGQWRVEELDRYAHNLDYRTAPIPYPADGVPLEGWSGGPVTINPTGGKPLAGWSNGNFMVVPSGAKNKKGAWEFMNFWSGVDNPERAAELYTWGGWLPITPEVANAPKYREFLERLPQFKTFVEILSSPNLKVTPPMPVQAYLMNRLTWAEDAARRRVMPPQAALEEASGQIQREIDNLAK